MPKNVSVIIPENASELILLSTDVIAQHVADGAGSVLNGLDMADMQAKTTTADTQDTLARNLSRDAETATETRNLALGASESFLAGTVMFFVTSIRDFLLGRFRGKEHKLGDWEFEVNEGADGSISVVIPQEASELILLAKGILAKHVADGAGSILNGFAMSDMQTQTTTAEPQHALAKKLEKRAEKAIEARDLALGHAKEQKSTTPGTVLYYVSSARDVLLGIFRGREHNLGDWGYEVNESGTAPAPSGTFSAVPPAVATGSPSTLSWSVKNLPASATRTIDNGIGEVGAEGTQVVTPATTTTYTLKAQTEDEEILSRAATVTVSP